MKQGKNAKGVRKKGVINIYTEPQLHREFAAACALQGKSMQAKVTEFMRTTANETFAAIRRDPPE